MAAEEYNCTDIMRALNQRKILIYGRPWNDVTVLHILQNPKYTGCNIWYRHTQRLRTPLRPVASEFWIGKPHSFPPMVDQQTFHRAQATMQKIRDSHWSAEKILKRVRRLLNAKRKLSERIFLEARGTPCTGTIRKFFGTYRNLYKILNYEPEYRHFYRVEQARRSACIRQALTDKLTKLFPENIEVFLSRRGARSVLRIDNKIHGFDSFRPPRKTLSQGPEASNREGTRSEAFTRAMLGCHTSTGGT
jgi:hypothetical protein